MNRQFIIINSQKIHSLETGGTYTIDKVSGSVKNHIRLTMPGGSAITLCVGDEGLAFWRQLMQTAELEV